MESKDLLISWTFHFEIAISISLPTTRVEVVGEICRGKPILNQPRSGAAPSSLVFLQRGCVVARQPTSHQVCNHGAARHCRFALRLLDG